MRARGPLALLVVGALAALLPLAYASPPDPTWIAGFWDDADYDDVVILVVSGAEVIAPSVFTFEPVLHALVVDVPASETARPAGARAPRASRAPPLA